MKKELLNLLACPECRSALQLDIFEEAKAATWNEITDGILRCSSCGNAYPVIEGIPRFIPNVLSLFPEFLKKHSQISQLAKSAKNLFPSGSTDEFLKVHGSTQERFGYEWMNYPGSMPEDKKIFLDETQIPSEDWRGKRVMDAGCGMGRYSRVAHELGATVVAMDLSQAVIRLSDVAKSSERMHLIQGNLMAPPLKEEIFDVVYSIGVIHHTPSAKSTFEKLSRLVKKGGNLTLWVYGTAGKYENFKTNPLRDDRKGLDKIRFVVWLTVLVRECISDTLRLVTVHLPHLFVYGLSYPLALIGKIPFIKYLTFSVHSLWRVRLQENFDWLSPPYQSHHTKEELIGWFEQNQFEVLKVLPHGFVPKPGVLGKKK